MKFEFALLSLAVVAAAKPTVYFIRHGEKPADDDNHMLSDRGRMRAQCIRRVFGADSTFQIKHIMAQTPKEDGKRQRPYHTVKPLAGDLGLDVDLSCDRDDPDCVKDVVQNYKGDGNILICWEHKRLRDIAETLGAKKVDKYPGDSFDLIWTDPAPYQEIVHVVSEQCPGLDD